eukprot:384377_1
MFNPYSFIIILTSIICSSYSQTIGVLDSLTFDEITTEQVDNYTTRQIGWIKMYSCIQSTNAYTYYHTAELSELQYYAISIKFVPPNSKQNPNYDNYAVVAKPCSNPVKALNHGKEVSFVFNEGTETYLEQANPDFWIGTSTAKARLTNTCNYPLRDANNVLYHSCGNTAGFHIVPSTPQCEWDYQNDLPDDIEVYFGFDINKQEYCNIPYRQIINSVTNNCIYENSRSPSYDPINFNYATCDITNDNQLWEITHVTNEWFKLKNKKSTCCIEMIAAVYLEQPDGTTFGCNACGDTNVNAQYFTMDDMGGSFRLRNKQTNTCMYQATNGRFGISDCSDTYTDQRWIWRIISHAPTISPTNEPTLIPTNIPTFQPTTNPTKYPSTDPSNIPTKNPTIEPTYIPTKNPTIYPSKNPTKYPTEIPTKIPTNVPSIRPTITTTITTSTTENIDTTDEGVKGKGNNGKLEENESNSMDKIILILIGLIGMVVMCIIGIIFVYCFCIRKRKPENENNMNKTNEFEGIELGTTSPESPGSFVSTNNVPHSPKPLISIASHSSLDNNNNNNNSNIEQLNSVSPELQNWLRTEIKKLNPDVDILSVAHLLLTLDDNMAKTTAYHTFGNNSDVNTFINSFLVHRNHDIMQKKHKMNNITQKKKKNKKSRR